MSANIGKKGIDLKAVEIFIPPMQTSLGINSEFTYLVKPLIKYKVMHIPCFFPCLKSGFSNVWNFHTGFFWPGLPFLLYFNQ